MRKASKVLGIIGGILAIVVALMTFGGGAFFNNMMPELMAMEDMSGYTVDEQAALDMTVDVGAGPYSLPYRWRPMRCRSLATTRMSWPSARLVLPCWPPRRSRK